MGVAGIGELAQEINYERTQLRRLISKSSNSIYWGVSQFIDQSLLDQVTKVYEHESEKPAKDIDCEGLSFWETIKGSLAHYFRWPIHEIDLDQYPQVKASFLISMLTYQQIFSKGICTAKT